MRNRLTALAVAVIGLPVLAACQPDGQGQTGGAALDTAAIMSTTDSVRQAYEDAYNAGDSAAIASMYAADAVYLPAGGAFVTGGRNVTAGLTQGMAQSQDFSISSSGTKILGADAVVDYGTVTNTVMPAGADSAVTQEQGYLVVVQRTADGWKLVRAANTFLQAPGGGSSGGGGGN